MSSMSIKNELIRRIGISFEDLVNRSAIPQEEDLFSALTTDTEEKERQVQEAMHIHQRNSSAKTLFCGPLACKRKGLCALEIH